jgi:hypothetical protein
MSSSPGPASANVRGGTASGVCPAANVASARAEHSPRAAHGQHARGLRVRVHCEREDRAEQLGRERAKVGHGEPDISATM